MSDHPASASHVRRRSANAPGPPCDIATADCEGRTPSAVFDLFNSGFSIELIWCVRGLESKRVVLNTQTVEPYIESRL